MRGGTTLVGDVRTEQKPLPWNHIERLSGRRLRTITNEKVFQVQEVTENRLILRITSTGKTRSISRHEFEAVWTSMSTQFKVSWNEVKDKHSSVNPSYIIAVLSKLPGVRVTTFPLEIRLKSPISAL